MRLRTFSMLIALTVACIPVLAQNPGDPLGEYLFPPELIMQNQQALALTDQQKDFLKSELRKAQLKFTELQWQLQDEVEKMAALAKQERIDEQLLLAQMDRVLAAEREIKRTQISLIVRIKNDLTSEQQTKLQELKKRSASK